MEARVREMAVLISFMVISLKLTVSYSLAQPSMISSLRALVNASDPFGTGSPPRLDDISCYLPMKELSGLNVKPWILLLQASHCRLQTAAPGGGEDHNLFPGKVVILYKGIHRMRRHSPPDGELKCSQFPSCVDFTGFNCIQNCVYCYYLSFFSKIALKHRPHYFHI